MTPAIRLLEQRSAPRWMHRYAHSADRGDYGAELCEQLDVPAERVFKTLVAQADTQELLAAVVPVVGRLQCKRLAAAAGCKKTAMAGSLRVEKSTGYVRGGISPLGQKRRLRTFIDASAKTSSTIYVSGGRRGLEIEPAPATLAELTAARWADLIDA